jgi:peptidoglycan/LPS O-acetylase OafA/YrhL
MFFGTLALAPAFVFPLETSRFISTFGLTLFYIGSGLILTATLTFDFGKHKIATFAAYVGSYSYSIYLWHMPVAVWLLPLAHWSWSVYFALYLVGSLSLGMIMGLLVEFPILRLRDRWFPSRARPPTISGEGYANALQRTGSAFTPAAYAAAQPAPPVAEL